MANGFMNPFGTQASIPFLFGEDQASQEALIAQQEAGNVAQQLVGLQDPRSEETIASADPIYGSAGPLAAFLPGNVGALKSVQGLSRFLPSLTKAPKQLPATTSQLPVPRIPRVGGPKRVEGTVINPLAIPKTSGSNVLPSLATLGLGTALVTDQLMQDPNAVQEGTAPTATTPQRAKSPLEIHTEYLKNLEEQGVSADERTQIAAQMIAPFLRDPAIQAESDAAFKAVSAQDLRDARNEAATKDVDSTKMSIADYRQLARQAGMKGSAVNAMAKQMQQEAETKAKKSETDIAATEALIAARSAPKATTVEKDLADIESRFGLVGVPFRNPDGTLTQAAEEAILAKGRIGETSTLGSGLTLTDELARQFLDQANGDKEEARRLAKEQGYTVS